MDGIASVVGGLDRGRRVGWSGFRIDRGLAFVAGFPLQMFLFAVGFLEVRASSADWILRVIGGSDF